MIEIVILAVLAFVASLFFDKAPKNKQSKAWYKLKMASSSFLTVIFWGVVICLCIILFLIIVRYIIFGDISGFFK